MKKNVSDKFFNELRKLAATDGYGKEKDFVFSEEAASGVKWHLAGHLDNRLQPYSASLFVGCRYLDASSALHRFLKDAGIQKFRDQTVAFGSMLEKYSTLGMRTHVCLENFEDAAQEAYTKFKEAEEAYLAPRVEQSFAVEEYLTKPTHKWPVADLGQCCLTIVSFGLLTGDPAMVKRGVERTFEILDRPNYSQMHREFFEALRAAVEPSDSSSPKKITD